MIVEGKHVLITGGTSGIGLATAHVLGKKGAKVFITGRRAELLQDALKSLCATGVSAGGVTADVTTERGRQLTIKSCLDALGGLDILINNGGGVRAGGVEDTPEAEIDAMLAVNLQAPILLTRAALPILRQSSQGMVVNVTSGIALVGMPFYATYAAAKARLAHFGEALRRELLGENIHVLTVYPGATDTPMMHTSKAGPDLGVVREPASAVADAIAAGIENNSLEVVRGGEERQKMIKVNREDTGTLDQRFAALKPRLEVAVREHSAL
jgi:uncharacterized oxidoreductase